MVSKRRTLKQAVEEFAGELRSVALQLNDSVALLQRSTKAKPCIGPHEFQGVLTELHDQVSELTMEMQNLESFTVDTISFEELLGHSLALYQANRNSTGLLEAHLEERYGYKPPLHVIPEPENPLIEAEAAAIRARNAGLDDHRSASTDSDDCGNDNNYTQVADQVANSRFGSSAALHSSAYALRRNKQLSTRKETRAVTSGGDEFDKPTMGDSPDVATKVPRAQQQQPRQDGDSLTNVSLAGWPTGVMSSRKDALTRSTSCASAFASMASIRSSARKIPQPRMDRSESLSPDPMLLSPSMAQVLAKYNPRQEDSDTSTGPNMAMVRSVAGVEEMRVGLQKMSPFGHAPAPASRDAAASGAFDKPNSRPQVADDDTCVLYREIIRSHSTRSIPTITEQRQETRAPEQPQTLVPPLKLLQLGTSQSLSPSRMAQHTAPHKPTTATKAAGASDLTPFVAMGRSCSVTPLSCSRATWQQHDKVLAGKFDELQRTWVESGQANRTASVRKSWGGFMTNRMDGGGVAGGCNLDAAFSRARSPSTQSQAIAPTAAGAHLRPVVTARPAGTAAVWQASQNMLNARNGPASARVLSPVQQMCNYKATPCRVIRSNSLPSPPGGTEATTVVGATTAYRHADVHSYVDMSAAKTAAGASLTSRGMPGRLVKATPSRILRVNSSPPNNTSTHTPARGSLLTGEEKAIRLTPPLRSLASESSATTVAPTPRCAGRIPTAVSATCLPVTAAVAAMPKSSRTPSRICISAGTSVAAAFAKDPQGPQAVPKLQLQFCKHPEERASGGFQGFPLSRSAESTRADGHVPGAADADDVILAMPPSVTGTPTSLTPGRGTSGGGSDAPVPMGNLSPGLSHLVSQSLGNGFIRQNNRSTTPSGRVSRIPTPVAIPRPGPRSGIDIPVTTTTADTCTSNAAVGACWNGMIGPVSTQASCSMAGGVPTAAAVDIELFSEQEWRNLPPRTQSAFPLDALNGYLSSLSQVVTTRAPLDRCFSVSDVESLSLGNLAAKLLINTLVKNDRCKVAPGGGTGGATLYRLIGPKR